MVGAPLMKNIGIYLYPLTELMMHKGSLCASIGLLAPELPAGHWAQGRYPVGMQYTWGKNRFAVVSVQNTEFILALLFINSCVIFPYKQL